jgi:hypothetical protein
MVAVFTFQLDFEMDVCATNNCQVRNCINCVNSSREWWRTVQVLGQNPMARRW